MSVLDEIDKIPETKLSSDMPDTITAILGSVRKGVKQGEYGGAPLLKCELILDDNSTYTVSYRIPKALTGKGQLDKLMATLDALGLTLKTAIGLKFKWQKQKLDGSIQGYERYYPVKQIKEK